MTDDDIRPRFHVGRILFQAFHDPSAIRKIVLGSVAVVFSVVPVLGLLPLWGYQARTIRNELRGDASPFAEWDDFGGILYDGLRVMAVKIVWSVVAAGATLVLVLATGASPAMLGTFDPPVILGALGGMVVVGTLCLGGFHVLCSIAITRMVAADNFREALRPLSILWNAIGSLKTGLALLFTVVLVRILGCLSVLLFVVGAIPGAFWAIASEGVAMGRAGRIMGIEVEDD